jgi:hypothetical protein
MSELLHTFRRKSPREKAATLVVTLLVLTLLSTIVIAFIQSVTMERSASRSSANRYSAELLADAAQADAIVKLKTTIATGPMAAVWDLDANQTPYLYLAKRVLSGASLVTERIPLFSTTYATNLTGRTHFNNPSAAQINTADTTAPDTTPNGAPTTRNLRASQGDVFVDLNAPTAALPTGPIGLLSAPNLSRPISANWIYVRDNSGRITGRYAYWLDDECSKLDLRFAGQAANAVGNHVRGPGTNFSDLSLLALTNVTNAISSSGFMENILELKAQTNLPLRSPSFLKFQINSATAIPTNIWNAIRPHVTTFSLHDDRSPDGRRRLNLNEVVTSPATAPQIQAQTFAIRDAITNSLPNFAQRYYSASNNTPMVPTADDQEIYATKIAANIRDFIDTDSSATVIKSDGTALVSQPADGLFIPYSPNDSHLPKAFGKEQGPFLSEYLRLVRVIDPLSPTSTATSTPVSITIRFVHYVELYNPSGREIKYSDLGPNPYVMISNRTPWNNGFVSGSPSVLELSDIKLYLPETFSIPPGGYAVVTNDGPPWRDNQTDYMGLSSNRYLCRRATMSTSIGKWEFVNIGGGAPTVDPDFEDYSVITSAIGGGPVTPVSSGGLYDLNLATSGATYSDQTERLSFGNDDGLIDYSLKIFSNDPTSIGRNNNNPTLVTTFLAEETPSSNTPTGNNNEARYSRGDSRSNTEISKISPDSGTSWRRGARSYGSEIYNDPTTGLQFSGSGIFSSIATINYDASQTTISGVNTWRYGWSEFTSDLSGNHFVKNSNVFSLGDLGSIYDPARYNINRYRSVGGTLRVGQSDASTNNRLSNTNLADAMNWLGGRGSGNATSANYSRNAYLLMDVFRTDTNVSGRINPNSLVRDTNAVALRAAMENFIFTSETTNQASSALAGRTLNATAALGELRNFFTNRAANGFITSPGDLSLAPIFWSTNRQLAGVSMRPGDGVSDAGREEFMRNTSNLLTTQSLAYTMFIKAQTGRFIQQGGTDRFEPNSTVLREVVVQLQPEYAPAPAGQPPYTPVAPSRWRTLFPYTISHQ